MRILGAGDNIVDCYVDLGLLFPGGNAVNVAVAARRSGADAAYVGVLGDDEAGRLIMEALRSEGVGTERTRVAHGSNAWVEIHRHSGDRVFGASSLGVSPFRLNDGDLAYAAEFDTVHLCAGGFLEEDVSAVAEVSAVSFDFKVRRERDYVGALLPHAEIAFFSASDLNESSSIALLESATRLGARMAIATRGPLDALAFDGRRLWRQAPLAREVIDTLGAGDSFIGRFIVGYRAGEDLASTLHAAAEAAAATCAVYGAFGHGRPYRDIGGTKSLQAPSVTAEPSP